MAFRAITKSKIHRYSSPNDPDQENPTVFLLRSLSARERATIRDKHMDFGMETDSAGQSQGAGIHLKVYGQNLDTCATGLTGWENFRDEAGAEVTCPTIHRSIGPPVVKEEALDFLPQEILTELAAEINRISDAPSEDSKSASARSAGEGEAPSA